MGCHTNGSQGVLVRTHMGPVLLAGDVVYMYDTIEQNRPGRSPDPDACIEAMAKIRSKADIVLPAHDPETLKRWPNGVIGGPGAFIVRVRDEKNFVSAIRRKLILEISGGAPRIIRAQAIWRQPPRIDCRIGEKLWDEWLGYQD